LEEEPFGGKLIFSAFLSGAFMMGLAVSGLAFLRAWKETNDKLFLHFGVAFFLLAVERVPLALFHRMKEPGSLVYLIRLLAFLIILRAISKKTFTQKKKVSASQPPVQIH
jgi:hypothetical protein